MECDSAHFDHPTNLTRIIFALFLILSFFYLLYETFLLVWCSEKFYTTFSDEHQVQDITILLISSCVSVFVNSILFSNKFDFLNKATIVVSILATLVTLLFTFRYRLIYGNRDREEEIIDAIRHHLLTHSESDLSAWFDINIGGYDKIEEYVNKRQYGSSIALTLYIIPWTILLVFNYYILFQMKRKQFQKFTDQEMLNPSQNLAKI